MASPRQRNAVLEGEEIAGDGEVAAIIAAGQADRRLGVRCRAAAHHHGAHRPSQQKSGTCAAGVPGVGSPVKKYPAREKPMRAVLRNVRRKDVGFLEAYHLLAQVQDVRAVGIERRRRHVTAIVNGIDAGKGIARGENVVDCAPSQSPREWFAAGC